MVIRNDANAAFNARMLQTTNKAQAKSMEKLSSGNKIVRSADDAAGLSISEKMLKQIQGLNKAIDNASDGMSMTNIADGAMDEVGGMLQRLNELAIQGSNGTLSQDERSAINAEAGQLLSDIDRVSGSTTFNEMKVLDNGSSDIQAGADNQGSNRIAISMQSMDAKTLGISGVNLSTPEGSRAALKPISDAIKSLQDQRSNLGAQYNRMSSTSRNLANVVENTTAANSRVKDTDMASEIMKLRKNRLLSKAQEQLAQKNREDRQAQAGALQNIQLH
ncbi:MAG: flagellin [Lachnospiraceae bacterium]|nr:flagellin [Lachnospiraceae bacterium]MCR5410332.1 flagellin [Lachnospiraceae bacterium]